MEGRSDWSCLHWNWNYVQKRHISNKKYFFLHKSLKKTFIVWAYALSFSKTVLVLDYCKNHPQQNPDVFHNIWQKYLILFHFSCFCHRNTVQKCLFFFSDTGSCHQLPFCQQVFNLLNISFVISTNHHDHLSTIKIIDWQ